MDKKIQIELTGEEAQVALDQLRGFLGSIAYNDWDEEDLDTHPLDGFDATDETGEQEILHIQSIIRKIKEEYIEPSPIEEPS